MKVTSREVQRDFARIRSVAASGETVRVTSGGVEVVFRRAPVASWQGALKGKVEIVGDLHTTGLDWEASQ
ncbi:MAG: hypothetical protein H7A46_26045 [Verrucomicrobiales bacterium]|nr:hypothetical protein [Verrucomicrobiales bacterium]